MSDGAAKAARRPAGGGWWRGGSLDLRARLTLAFAAIILLCLLLAGSAVVFILRDYQIRREMNRVAELAQPLSWQVRSLEQQGASRQEIVEFIERQADELDLRIVLADNRGNVFADTEDGLVGHQLQIQQPPRFGAQRRIRVASYQGPGGDTTFMVSPSIGPAQQATQGQAPPPPGSGLAERFLGRQSAYIVGLGIPRQTLATAWLELLPRLSLAGLVALLASAGVAWLLAASISRPLARITRAAEAIAQGDLDQQIPVRGRDEVARLAAAFNTMAREVAASHRTLRDFLANVSHDLRTPLTSIQGFSQALTDGTVSEPAAVAEVGEIIRQEAGRMAGLVDDVLLLSRMESGQDRQEAALLDLGQLAAERVRAFARQAAEAGVELRWAPRAAPAVVGDAARLEQVLDNLLSNALRHTPAGGRVEVSLEWAAQSRHASERGALLQVANSGSHIPPQELGRVFERFYQVDKSRAAGSSGLGLAIVRQIALAHSGRCWVESSPEHGTRFSVWLPARSVPLADETAEDVAVARPFAPPLPVIEVGRAHPPA